MSFLLKYKTLKSGITYHLHTCPEMSAQEEETPIVSEIEEAERNTEDSIRVFLHLIGEKSKRLWTLPYPDFCSDAINGQIKPRQLG